MSAYDLGQMIPLEDSDGFSVGATLIQNESGMYIASSVYEYDEDEEVGTTTVTLQEVGDNIHWTKVFTHEDYNHGYEEAELFGTLLVTTVSEDGDWQALFSDTPDPDTAEYDEDDLDAEAEVLGVV